MSDQNSYVLEIGNEIQKHSLMKNLLSRNCILGFWKQIVPSIDEFAKTLMTEKLQMHLHHEIIPPRFSPTSMTFIILWVYSYNNELSFPVVETYITFDEKSINVVGKFAIDSKNILYSEDINLCVMFNRIFTEGMEAYIGQLIESVSNSLQASMQKSNIASQKNETENIINEKEETENEIPQSISSPSKGITSPKSKNKKNKEMNDENNDDNNDAEAILKRLQNTTAPVPSSDHLKRIQENR